MYHIHIIHGPSCAGKSTFLSHQKGQLIELDDISNQLANELESVATIIQLQTQILLEIDHCEDTYVTASFLPQLHKNPHFWTALESKISYEIRHILVLPRFLQYIGQVRKRYLEEERVYTAEQIERYQFMSKDRRLDLVHYTGLYFQYYDYQEHYDCVIQDPLR